MTATIAQYKSGPGPTQQAKSRGGNSPGERLISWKEFQSRYLNREDGFKYEWLNGTVEKSKRGMDKTQLYILRTLTNFFIALKNKGLVSGNLISEPDLFFLANHRRPDICWLSDEQIDRLAFDSRDVPAFVIEVISTNDQMNKVHKKMRDYDSAGVKVVWHIFPLLGEVHVYGGQRLASMSVRRGEEICSAAPVLPDFELTVETILQKPALSLVS